MKTTTTVNTAPPHRDSLPAADGWLLRRAGERGHAEHGWLDSHHTFSFADYHDPAWMGFRSLRVINDDVVAGGAGFGTHPHRDMEILTFVLEGALQHQDSMGHAAVLRPGDMQRISAGSGITHSEFNYSPVDPVHFLQVWILPNRRGGTPSYEERVLGQDAEPRLRLAASLDGRDGSTRIHQDVDVWRGRLPAGATVRHGVRPGRHLWIHVAEGEVELDGLSLRAGDAAGRSVAGEVTLHVPDSATVLLFDLN